MQIWKEYSKCLHHEAWFFRFQFDTRNHQRGGFDKYATAEAAILAMLHKLQLQK
ncbi:MAG TPA: hypothetical protein VGB73_16325 [Pyrinomonadaceae bacterium]|jgi:hypothetical protein